MLNQLGCEVCGGRPNTAGAIHHSLGCRYSPIKLVDVKIVALPAPPTSTPKVQPGPYSEKPAALVGWRCPNCGACLSPYTAVCPCTPTMRPTLTSTGTGPIKVGSFGS